MTKPTADEIKAIARVAGVPLEDATAAQRVKSIGPALDGFAPIAGALPFDLEPSHFVIAQKKATAK